MADDALPVSWSNAGKSALGNSLWILPLVAIEGLTEAHWWQAASVGGSWLAAIVLAVKLHVFQEFFSDHRGVRSLLTWGLILGGAVLLAIGIFRLAGEGVSIAIQPGQPADAKLVDSQQARANLEGQLAEVKAELRALQDRSRAAAPSPPRVIDSNRAFTEKTIRQLKAMYEGRTALQAEAFIGSEKGKWIDTEGVIARVDAGMMFLHDGNDPIECRFDAAWNAKLATFRHNEVGKVRGKIAQYQNGAQIYLDECELRD